MPGVAALGQEPLCAHLLPLYKEATERARDEPGPGVHVARAKLVPAEEKMRLVVAITGSKAMWLRKCLSPH